MEPNTDKYLEFVEHPRYGRGPRYTGLDPRPTDANVHLHWNTTTHREVGASFVLMIGIPWPYGNFSAYIAGTKRIPNTAIPADPSKQIRATVPVTHYFDLERRCRDCKRPFIFFAEEQRHWYEELGFGLESDCVRCTDCRKKQRGIERLRQRYDVLFHTKNKSEQQIFELAECCVKLVEQDVFKPIRLEFARMLLNKIDSDSELRQRREYEDLIRRSRPPQNTAMTSPMNSSDGSGVS